MSCQIITSSYLLSFPNVNNTLGFTNGGTLSQQSGVLTANNSTITGLISTAGFYANMPVYGPGIQYGSAVVTINSATSITINQVATQSGTFVLSFGTPTTFQMTGTTNSDTSITALSSTTNIGIGASVSGTGIPTGTTVTEIVSSTAITISQAATNSATETLSFSVTGFLDNLIQAATKVMEDYVGFPFCVRQAMEFYDGVGYRDIALRRPYVTNVQTVALDFITGGAYAQFGLNQITGATITANSATVTLTSTSGLSVGQLVLDGYPPTGTIIPLATYITTINSSTQITLSNAALVNATSLYTSGSFSQQTNLAVGNGYALVYQGNYGQHSPQALLRFCPSYLSTPGIGGWWNYAGYGFGYGQGSLTLQGQGNYGWPCGSGNVMVTYTAGWTEDTIPSDLKIACVELCVFIYQSLAQGGFHTVSETLSKYSYTLGQLEQLGGSGISCNGALGSVRSILSRYRLLSL